MACLLLKNRLLGIEVSPIRKLLVLDEWSSNILSLEGIMKTMCLIFIFLISVLVGISEFAHAEIVVHEDFNDRLYMKPLVFYNAGADVVYNSAEALGANGNCLQWNHSTSMTGIGILENLGSYLQNGVYIRYWVKYSPTYYFPGDEGVFDNIKMLKFAGGGDIEFIYKDTAGGPKRLQLYWITSTSTVGGTGTGSVAIPSLFAKGVWHKIEIYMRLGTPSVVHVQIDDGNVYHNTNADISLPASAYTISQFMSTRASNHPPDGHGIWYTDNITVAHNEGDLCDREPAEPSQPDSNLSPPTLLKVLPGE